LVEGDGDDCGCGAVVLILEYPAYPPPYQGFVFASDYEQGQNLVAEREYKQHEVRVAKGASSLRLPDLCPCVSCSQEFYQRLIEIARRHKIMNPEKMRGEYGKLLYLLQDSVSPNIQAQLGFSFITGISTGVFPAFHIMAT